MKSFLVVSRLAETSTNILRMCVLSFMEINASYQVTCIHKLGLKTDQLFIFYRIQPED